MSLELRDGKPRLLTDYGTGVRQIELTKNIADGEHHKIVVLWDPSVSYLQKFLLYSSNKLSNHAVNCELVYRQSE